MTEEVVLEPLPEVPNPVPLEEMPPAAVEPMVPRSAQPHSAFLKIPVTVQVVLGRRRMPLSEVMELAPGSIVVLDQELAQPVSLQVNGSEVARGLLSVVDEETGQLGITLTEIAAMPKTGADT